jgi:hypothetical protein
MRHAFPLVLLAVFVTAPACSSRSSNGDGEAGVEVEWQAAEPAEEVAAPEQGDVVEVLEASDATPEEAAQAEETIEESVEAEAPPLEVVELIPEIIPDPPEVVSGEHCSPAGGDLNIYDLRDPACPDHPGALPTAPPGLDVALKGVVLTADFSDTMFVQEKAGGAYSGLAVFKHGKFIGEFAVGDLLDLEGSLTEYFGQTQLYLNDATKVGSAATAPQPFDVPHPSQVATGGVLAEPFEGVLLRVHDVEVQNTRPDCPHDFGEFRLNGGLRVDDLAKLEYVAQVGDQLAEVVGPLAFTFNNSKLEPRDDFDVALTQAGQGGQTKCIEGECIEPLDAPESGAAVVNEIMYDPAGEDTGKEWFEVYNPGDAALDLRGWTVRDCAQQAFHLPQGAPILVQPHDWFVFGANGNSDDNGGVPVDYVYGTGFYLANTTGAILLYDADDLLVDQVRFTAFDPWVHEQGHSIALKDPAADNTHPDNWKSSTKKYGEDGNYGTPGKQN